MLFDCFLYFNEKELLELRYELLKDVVDGFIITDANRTFKGDEKPFTCVDTLRELGIPEDKVQVLHVELPSKEEIFNPWAREYAQRDALAVGMRMTPPDSVFFFSDVDEIPKPLLLIDGARMAKGAPHRCFRLSMPMLYGRADLRVKDPKGDNTKAPNNWVCGTFVLPEHLNGSSLSQIRRNPNDCILGQCNAGWHFSWMGGPDRLKTKVQSFSHCYDDIPNSHAPSSSKEILEFMDSYKAVPGATDPLGRHDHILEEYPHELLPEELFRLDRVKKFLLPE
jgi:beta-1,4-mannosyl-glycoprotein beta-1,4-N-acetylglucosaminyltransferase